jgi:hypothetical protein
MEITKKKDSFGFGDLRMMREILYRAIISTERDDANDIVDLVNVIQVKFGEEPYADINDFICRQYWSQNLGNIKDLPEIKDIALRNDHYGLILKSLAKSLQKGWNDDENEILDTINICLRNYNEDALCEYDSIQTFLEEWEELLDE